MLNKTHAPRRGRLEGARRGLMHRARFIIARASKLLGGVVALHVMMYNILGSCINLQRALLRRGSRFLSFSADMAGIKSLRDGTYPTMITPFSKDNSIDWNGVDLLTEWYIKSGVAGIFSICLSSEMFHLSNDERIAIARRVKEKAAGRVPVVIGATFEGGLEEQAKLMNTMGEFADSVVIITNQICGMDESDEVWLANCKKLMDQTGTLPLGLYETPYPKVRSLTPSMVKWVAESGRFNFFKDTSLHMNTLLEKIEAVKAVEGTPLKIYTAKTQFTSGCIDAGGNGFSGVLPNYFPWLKVWLTQQKEDTKERKKVQDFVSIADRVIAHKYPLSAKYYLATFYGMPIQPTSRMIQASFNDQDTKSLRSVKDGMEEVCKELGIATVDPNNPY